MKVDHMTDNSELNPNTNEIEENEKVETDSKKKEENPFSPRALFDWVEIFAVSIAVVFLLFAYVARIAVVDGGSMLPTLTNGDKVIVRQIFYTPKQGDIVVCQSEKYGMDKPLVKRVIATEGQTVSIDRENWKVYVDGEPLDESYVFFETGLMNGWDYNTDTITVKKGHVFVMGDHRNDSLDSRSMRIGQIDERYVIGKVVYRFMPLKNIGIVK
jgi:signal peptidase I